MNTVFRRTGEQSNTWGGGGCGDRHLLKCEYHDNGDYSGYHGLHLIEYKVNRWI